MTEPFARPLAEPAKTGPEARPSPKAFLPAEVRIEEHEPDFDVAAADPDQSDPRLPRMGWPARLAWGAGGLFLSLALGLFADSVINDLFARYSWLGWAGVALLAAFVVAAVSLAERLTGTPGVALVITGGEETGCDGAAALARDGILGRAGALVVAEPPANAPLAGHKGALWLKAVTRGVTAHGSMPELGVNAVFKAARAVSRLEDFDFNLEPHPHLGKPTLNVGSVHGGLNINSVPDRAEIGIDIRTVAGLDHDRLRHGIAGYLGDDVELEPLVDLQAELARHERGWPVGEVVEQGRPRLAGDLDQVREARGRHERDGRGRALEHRVRGDRRAVGQLLGARTTGHRARPGPDRATRVVGRGEDLGDPAVGPDRIGERPPAVDPDPRHPPPPPVLSCVASRRSFTFSMPSWVRRYSPETNRLVSPTRAPYSKLGS